MATVTTSRRKNTLKEITRKIPSQFKIFENNVIFFHHNSYSIGQFIGASRQYCHIHSLPTDSPLRILWHSVYVITANVQSIETLPNVAISGFLALDPDALCYKRTHKIDGDIVTFNRTELPRKLSPITVYKSKEYPSIVPMIPAINCQFYAEIIQKIPSKHVIKYVNTITSNGDASDLDIESINECKSESPSRGTKRPLSELIVYKSGNPPKKQKQSLIYSFTTNTANDSNTNRKPMTLITPKKHSQNSSKSNTKSMKKSAKKSLSQTEIAQNATEKYKFTDDIIIYDLNGKRYVHLNDKYTQLNRNNYLFTQSRISTLPDEFSKKGEGLALELNCDSCNKWWRISVSQNKEFAIDSQREKHIIKGLKVFENLTFDAAICDRGFSIQNLIITKDRTLIKTAYLRDGMIVCIEGPKWANGTAVKDLMLRALERFSKCANYE